MAVMNPILATIRNPGGGAGQHAAAAADLGRLAHHRAAELLHRPHRSRLPRPRAARRARQRRRRLLRGRRHGAAGAARHRGGGGQGPRGHQAWRARVRGPAPRRLGPQGARSADQDRDGVAAEIIYPTVGMVICNHRRRRLQAGLHVEAYNRWLAGVLRRSARPPVRHGPDRRCARAEEGIEDLAAHQGDGLQGRDDAGQSRQRRGLRPPESTIRCGEAAVELGAAAQSSTS